MMNLMMKSRIFLKNVNFINLKFVPGSRSITGYPQQTQTWDMKLSDLEDTYISFFSNPKHDIWDIRQGINDFAKLDEVPSVPIIISVLRACRRINEHSMCVRYLEFVERKSATYRDQFWPYIVKEITPVLKELGISTPKELGYDKPELACSADYSQSLDNVEPKNYAN